MMRSDVMISVEDIPEIFNDLTPILQNDGPTRVCVIQYPSSFTLAYNYMRAVWAAKELSGKVFYVSCRYNIKYLSDILHILMLSQVSLFDFPCYCSIAHSLSHHQSTPYTKWPTIFKSKKIHIWYRTSIEIISNMFENESSKLYRLEFSSSMFTILRS